MEAGKPFGIRHCGYYAMHAVRIEKVKQAPSIFEIDVDYYLIEIHAKFKKIIFILLRSVLCLLGI